MQCGGHFFEELKFIALSCAKRNLASKNNEI